MSKNGQMLLWLYADSKPMIWKQIWLILMGSKYISSFHAGGQIQLCESYYENCTTDYRKCNIVITSTGNFCSWWLTIRNNEVKHNATIASLLRKLPATMWPLSASNEQLWHNRLCFKPARSLLVTVFLDSQHLQPFQGRCTLQMWLKKKTLRQMIISWWVLSRLFPNLLL